MKSLLFDVLPFFVVRFPTKFSSDNLFICAVHRVNKLFLTKYPLS